jgi:hypothetical protein
MKQFIILILIALSINVSAQSPFRRLERPVPEQKYGLSLAPAVPVAPIIAWRISAPTVGWLYTKGKSQVATSLGFGWTKNVWDTAKGGSWYTQIGINVLAIGGGTIAPNPTDLTTVMSVGIGVTFLRGHLNIAPVYNIPKAGQPKGIGQNLGVFVNTTIPIFPL